MVQPPAGEQSYGPSAAGTDGDERPPVKRDNDFASAGITLAIVPPLGLIFSIIGLTKSGALGGAGKTLSIAGIVVSLLIGAGIGAVVVSVSSAAADPGCVTVESFSPQLRKIVSADEASISRDQNDLRAARADWRHLVADFGPVQTQVALAEDQARNQPVKAALSALMSDLKTFTSGMRAALSGDHSQDIQVAIAAERLGRDGDAVYSRCTA